MSNVQPSNACRGAGTLDDVIKRSSGSSEVQERIAKLPDVAPMPARKRTFHLSHEELETHVRPLLACHWHVAHVGTGIGDQVAPSGALSLNKLLTFKNFRSAVEFFNGLVDIQDEEDHHARVTVDYSRVYVAIHTHCAYTDATSSTKVPGLTARDIRFAVRVEQLHGTFLEDGRAVTKIPANSASLQAWSMEQVQRRYPNSS